MPDQIEIVTRYSACGLPDPDPATMCGGQCDGMGVVPVSPDAPNDEEGPWADLWDEAERTQGPTDDGYHFVICPRCNGTRLEP